MVSIARIVLIHRNLRRSSSPSTVLNNFYISNKTSGFNLSEYRFSWSIFLIGILHCLVWSLGVTDQYSQIFFNNQTISLQSGGALSVSGSNPYSEEEYRFFASLAKFTLLLEEKSLLQQQALQAAANTEEQSKHQVKLESALINNSNKHKPERFQLLLLSTEVKQQNSEAAAAPAGAY
jgi:hypothetical protein